MLVKKWTFWATVFLILGSSVKSQSYFILFPGVNDRFLKNAEYNIEYADINTEALSVALSSGGVFPTKILTLTNLRALRLCRGGNSTIPVSISLPNQTINLKRLNHLILDNLNIETLPSEIGQIDSLQSFYYRSEKTGTLQFPDFSGKNLKFLYIDLFVKGTLSTSKNFTNFFEARLLTDLYFINCNLSQNDLTGLSKLSKLRSLHLCGNKLTEVEFASGNSELEILDLDDNEITKLPSTNNHLRKLKVLSLRSNNINDFPVELCNLNELKELNLDKNKIASLPLQIKELKKLETLSLRDNAISEIPAGVFELSNLKVLDLMETNIKNIPVDILKLENLEELRISSRNVGELVIDAKLLAQLKKLKSVQISTLKAEKDINSQAKKLKKLRPDISLNI